MNAYLKSLMTSLFCHICNKSLLGASQTDHYSSKKHHQNIVAYVEHVMMQNVANSRLVGLNFVQIPTVLTTLSTARPIPLIAQRAMEQVGTYSCYVCNLGFPMQSQKEAHVKEFPHCIMAPMKSEMIRRGFDVEFLAYSRRKRTLTCNLCNVKMINTKTASDHLNGKSHIQILNNWCANFAARDLPETSTQWYYCKICNVFLDGTSDANQHYKEEPHRLRVVQTQQPSNLALPSSNIVNFPPKLSVSESKSGSKPVTPCQKLPKSMSNFKDLQLTDFISILASKKTDGESSEWVSVKDELFSEINKLVQTLYYSQKLPYNVSLQYLKKVNEDVKELVKKYQRPEIDDRKSEVIVEDTDVMGQEKGAMANTNFVSEPTETIDLIKKKGNLFSNQIVKTSGYEASASGQFINNIESKLIDEKPKSIVEMLRKVESEKSKLIETNPSTLEIDVLREIEDLLKQMNQPKKLAKEILKYLKTFNESLHQKKIVLVEDTPANISPELDSLLRNQNMLIDALNRKKKEGD